MDNLNTYSIDGVEVFSEGEWNKDKYSINDLHSMVEAFNTLKGGFKPYLKLGHDEKQHLMKSSGLPAIGWVEKLYIKGTKLVADFKDIPKDIYKLIKAKAYRKVSCEIFWDLDVNGVQYPRVLGAIALLGAETPGVMNLSDILSNYTLINQNNSHGVFEAMDEQGSFRSYAIDFEPQMEDEKMSEVIEKEVVVDDSKAALGEAQAALEAKGKELESVQAELVQFREAAVAAQAEAKSAKVAQFVGSLESKKLVTPAMKDLMTEILSDKKEYTVKDKSLSKEEVMEQILTLAQEAAKVNFDESSRADYAKGGDKMKDKEAEMEKYALDNKCSLAQAYKAVMKKNEFAPKEKEEEEKA